MTSFQAPSFQQKNDTPAVTKECRFNEKFQIQIMGYINLCATTLPSLPTTLSKFTKFFTGIVIT